MKKYLIITYGCQMNKNDSERIGSFFEENGLEEGSEKDADVIVINSCSVRQSAVDRIRGKIKNIKKIEKNPLTILTGCLLEKDKKEIGSLFDYVLKTEDLLTWPLSFLKNKEEDYFQVSPKRKSFAAHISIMTGCDNFCTYCVVPYTRGKPFSRKASEIICEAERAVKEGYREIWLLGQNVNAYNGGMSFPNLLREINKIKGDFWIRFTSSHPKDFSDDLISAMKNCKKIPPYLNLPIQSGDNEILEKMNRPYRVEDYKDLVFKIRKNIPGIALSTDIIVGFPGEKEKHFRNTVNLFHEISFDMIYISRYSPRRQTAAYKMKENVLEEEKKRREKILEELLKEKNLEKNKKLQEKKLKVLATGLPKKGFLSGKTEKYKTVTFKGKKELLGKFLQIKITSYSSWGLKGVIIQK